MESIQEVGLSCFFPKALSTLAVLATRCRQVNWVSRFHEKLPREYFSVAKQDDSLCQVWGGIPIQISEDENYVLTHIGDGSNDIKVKNFPLGEPTILGGKCTLQSHVIVSVDVSKFPRKMISVKLTASVGSHITVIIWVYTEQKNSSCHDCGEDVMKVFIA